MKRWTAEESERLEYLYENGGDKACLPMRLIAERLSSEFKRKFTQSACWSKIRRICKKHIDNSSHII